MASRLEPGDLVTLTTTEGQIYDVRLTKSTTGSDNRVHWETVRHRSYLYEDFAAFPAEEPGGVIVIQRPAAVELFVVEYPPLDDDVESLRLGFAVCRSTGVGDFFPVTTIFESTDGGASYQAVMLYQTAATVGTVASVSPVVQLHTWDRVSVLTVVLRPGSPPLTSASEEAPHYAMLGEECVAFVHVTATALETYELRILRRGSRGTEQRLPSGAPVSFVLLNAVLRNRTRTLRTPDIGLTRHYKAVPSGTNIAAVTEQAVPFRGVHGRPWAPVSVQASRSDTGVWTITWLHRSRVRGTWIDLSGITYDADDLGQDDVTVYTATDPPVAVQTYRPTHPARAETPGTLVYTLALQEEDFGSAQAALTVGVRHLRAGLLGEETRLQTTTGWRWDGENVAWPPAVIPTWYATFD
jgi:hypothetical protein